MARIRTIKPEFFTSEDITTLTPLSRLFYAALWCESDREGRFEYKPGTLKNRYFPADNCSVPQMTRELANQGLIRLYKVEGRAYGEVLRFAQHQVINNRETDSKLPSGDIGEDFSIEPEEIDASLTRESGVKATSVGEGKGREGKGKELRISAPAEPEQFLDPLYHPLMKAMEEKKGEPFANYGQEGKNAKLLLKRLRGIEKDHADEALKAVLETYYRLTKSGDKFWAGQPFTPSRLLTHLEAVIAEAKKGTPSHEEEAMVQMLYGGAR